MVEVASNLDTLLVPKGLIHGGELTDFTKEIAMPLHLGSRKSAGQAVADYLKLVDENRKPVVPKDDLAANVVLTTFLQFLLDEQRYGDAAALLWPATMFTAEPSAVRRLWDSAFQHVATGAMGAASMGKSYDLGVWLYLDWRRDPQFTNVQIVGPSEEHLEKNMFTHLVKLHRQASIQGPGETAQRMITLDTVERNSGIFGVVVPIGKKSAGRLQGVKVLPRAKPHPQFGRMSRVRVMLEEAENIPVGIHDDVTNIMSNAAGSTERFKIFMAWNPKDPSSAVAQRAEPVDGWLSLDLEASMEWMSKRGFHIVRLDAHQSENVIAGQEIYVGLQTKEGLERVTMAAGGAFTAGWYTMARGFYPPTGIDLAVIPQHLMADITGEFVWSGPTQGVGALDVALEGGDNAVFAYARFGTATAWKKPPSDISKEPQLIPFTDQFGNRISKQVIQLEQLFALPKGKTIELAAKTKEMCNAAYVQGPMLGVDRTGNGAGVHDILVTTFHVGVKGINPSTTPTERKILTEDQKLPVDEYSYLLSELWFALRKFIEFGFFKVSPKIPMDPLFQELTGRRFLHSGKKIKVESKKEYKSRGNKSPDRADACTMLVHTVRLQLEGPPSATMGRVPVATAKAEQRIGCTDMLESLDGPPLPDADRAEEIPAGFF